MKSIAIVSGILLLSAVPMLADEASKNAKIDEMLQLTHVDKMTAQVLDQMRTTVATLMEKTDVSAGDRARMEEMQQKIMAMVADRMSWQRAKPAYIKIYADTYSEGEIDGILAFYKSPAGQAVLEKTPRLIQKSMELSQQLMSDIMPQIQRMTEELKQNSDGKQ